MALIVVGLTSTQENLWWGAVIGGFVIVLAVAALLTILVLLVRTIDRRVVVIRSTLQDAVANTAALAQLQTTIESAEVITAGLRRGRARLGG